MFHSLFPVVVLKVLFVFDFLLRGLIKFMPYIDIVDRLDLKMADDTEKTKRNVCFM